MVLHGALLLLLKSLFTALLVKVSVTYAVLYYIGDMAMYLLYRILRRDLTHWLPVEGVAGALMTISIRVAMKVIVDFTGIIQFRAPGEFLHDF